MIAVTDAHELELQAMRAAVTIQRNIQQTGRCLCGRRPTIRERVRDFIARHV